jgi:hypothetical protein
VPTLAALAETAAGQPTAAFVGWVHEVRDEAGSRGAGGRLVRTLETWADPQGGGAIGYLDQSVTDPAGNRTSPPDDEQPAEPGTLKVGPLEYSRLATLPGDPEELLAVVERSGAPTRQQQIEVLAQLTTLAVVPAEARAAALEVFGLMGGSTVGPATDRLGRSGVAVTIELEEGSTATVVVDPATGIVLEWWTTPEGGDPLADGDHLVSVTLRSAELVDAPGSR